MHAFTGARKIARRKTVSAKNCQPLKNYVYLNIYIYLLKNTYCFKKKKGYIKSSFYYRQLKIHFKKLVSRNKIKTLYFT